MEERHDRSEEDAAVRLNDKEDQADGEWAAELMPTLSGNAFPARDTNADQPLEDKRRAMPSRHTAYSTMEERREARHATREAGHAIGWVSFVFAIASLFVWPILLGATAAVLGVFAYRQGSRSLGVWSITLGLIALAAHLVLIPIYYLVV